MSECKEKTLAKSLYKFLKAQCKSWAKVSIEGEGIHWHVEIKKAPRRCSIHCMHYGDMDGLWLGMRGNTHLRGTSNTPQKMHRGAEYLVAFYKNEERICEGRTYDYDSIYECGKAWILAQHDREELYAQFDFIDKNTRALQALAKQIDASQQRHGSAMKTHFEPSYTGDVGVELWVYGEYYSCRICTSPTEAISCSFFLHATLLASLQSTNEDIESSVHLWIDKQISVAELAQKFPQLQISDFAQIFERGDYAEWHWHNVLQQARNGDGVLEYYLPIIEKIVTIPEIRRFFSFTSLNMLCFSRCSHYPFRTEGLPVLYPTEEGCLVKCGEEHVCGDADVVCNFLAQHLKRLAMPTPYLGTIEQGFIEPINDALQKRGSDIRLVHKQKHQWSGVQAVKNNRSCKLEIYEGEDNLYGLLFRKEDAEIALGRFATVEAVAAAIDGWLNKETLPPDAQDLKGLVSF